jgi:hypothetical protein
VVLLSTLQVYNNKALGSSIKGNINEAAARGSKSPGAQREYMRTERVL